MAGTYTLSKQVYYYKNKKKILNRTREARKKWWKDYYAKNKELINARNKARREAKKIIQEQNG